MKILAVDFGDVRTGLAVCDRQELLAAPLGVITERKMAETVRKVAEAALAEKVEEVVVGHPLNMNGTAGPRSELCREFARLVGEASGLPVRLWDERRTTVSAAQILNVTDTRGKKRKAVVDAVAATIILESYLAFRKNHKPEEG